ncbi:MAG TPA: AGE family epimerase/isomerase [Caulobacterales bacterium]|jgi:mannose-6-phosphate isomerase|nr:AGE family epimerase/isomerase [Caulobacterales bacterium]
MSAALAQRAAAAKGWLLNVAFPLWADKGFDAATGLFHEKLNADLSPAPGPRRVRVQARQIYCFALAGRMGWSGPWRERVEAGFATLSGAARAEGGAVGHLLDARGKLPDARRDLYDQAFALLACAHATPVVPDAPKRAHEIMDFIEHSWKSPKGGYEEGEVEPPLPRRQNPHMHLFEAALALQDAAGAARWRPLAQQIASLFNAHFFDAEYGVLREFFEADWKPSATKGSLLEPGHHFEWVWLLARWRDASGEDTGPIAAKLYEYGERYGINTHDVAVDEMLLGGGMVSARARLWPQTERLKAALARLEDGSGDAEAVVNAYDKLALYLDAPAPGLWRDRMNEDGSFVDEPAPASSFYHIAVALDELIRLAEI